MEPTTLPTAKVLVVDDDTTFRRSVARILTNDRYECVEAAHAVQATLALAAHADIAAVLCDVRMPGQSGIALLREWSTDHPDLAVLMTTGVDDPRIAEIALDIGADGYLVKPFEGKDLLATLAESLRRRHRRALARAEARPSD